jgi:hypothetical protein
VTRSGPRLSVNWTLAKARSQRLRRASRRSERRCINCGCRLRARDGTRCRADADRAASASRAWQRRVTLRRRLRQERVRFAFIGLETRLIEAARRRAVGAIDRHDRARRVTREYDRLRATCGLPVLVVNEPPPGWSVEEDRREELLAIGEHLALRKVS